MLGRLLREASLILSDRALKASWEKKGQRVLLTECLCTFADEKTVADVQAVVAMIACVGCRCVP